MFVCLFVIYIYIHNKIIVIENADPGYDFIFSKKISGLITKYGGAPTAPPQAIAASRAGIEAGNSWVFELVPREIN